MTVADNAKIKVNMLASLLGSGDFQNASAPIDYLKTFTFTNGTGANQFNEIFSDQRTLAASASESLDLAGGITDSLGTTVTFTAIKAILVFAAAANTNNVVVGNAASNQFQGPFGAVDESLSIPPGGMVLLINPSAAGWAVTASTGDLLKIANSSSGTSVTYDIVIFGEVA